MCINTTSIKLHDYSQAVNAFQNGRTINFFFPFCVYCANYVSLYPSLMEAIDTQAAFFLIDKCHAQWLFCFSCMLDAKERKLCGACLQIPEDPQGWVIVGSQKNRFQSSIDDLWNVCIVRHFEWGVRQIAGGPEGPYKPRMFVYCSHIHDCAEGENNPFLKTLLLFTFFNECKHRCRSL